MIASIAGGTDARFAVSLAPPRSLVCRRRCAKHTQPEHDTAGNTRLAAPEWGQMPKFAAILAAACLAAGLSTPASAAEYCVTCEGPPGLYRCVIDGTPDGPGNDPAASVHCISQIARQGQHERCAVSRGAPFPCPGLTALVPPPSKARHPAQDNAAPYPEPKAPSAALPGEQEQPAEQDTTAQPPQAAETPKVPRTVEELAGQTVRSSKEGLEKAGQAIGGTAKKAGEVVGETGSAIGKAASNTWSCITSLFTSCGGSADDDLPNDRADDMPDEAPHRE